MLRRKRARSPPAPPPAAATTAAPVAWASLPSELLLCIFELLPLCGLIRILPLVCRRWRNLASLAVHALPTLRCTPDPLLRVLKTWSQVTSLRVLKQTPRLDRVLQALPRLKHLTLLKLSNAAALTGLTSLDLPTSELPLSAPLPTTLTALRICNPFLHANFVPSSLRSLSLMSLCYRQNDLLRVLSHCTGLTSLSLTLVSLDLVPLTALSLLTHLALFSDNPVHMQPSVDALASPPALRELELRFPLSHDYCIALPDRPWVRYVTAAQFWSAAYWPPHIHLFTQLRSIHVTTLGTPEAQAHEASRVCIEALTRIGSQLTYLEFHAQYGYFDLLNAAPSFPNLHTLCIRIGNLPLPPLMHPFRALLRLHVCGAKPTPYPGALYFATVADLLPLCPALRVLAVDSPVELSNASESSVASLRALLDKAYARSVGRFLFYLSVVPRSLPRLSPVYPWMEVCVRRGDHWQPGNINPEWMFD